MRGSLRTGRVAGFTVIVALSILSLRAATAEDDPALAAILEARRWIGIARFDKAIEILKPLAASEELKRRPEYALVLEYLGEAHLYGQERVLAEKELKESIPLLEESAKTDTGKSFLYLTSMSVAYHSLGVITNESSRWKECADYHTRGMLLPYTTMAWRISPRRAARAPSAFCPLLLRHCPIVLDYPAPVA